MTQWSTPMTVTFCLYILFILVVFSISFPLKSHKTSISRLAAMGMNRENIMIDDNEANGFGEIEQKFLQRAHDLPATNNRTDILRDAFQR